MPTLLLEIGVEELPSSFVDAALTALPGLVAGKLAELRLTHGEIRALGTPRRLGVLASSVADMQPDLDEEVMGPPETAAYKDGKPTKAADAFAAKLGVPVDALVLRDVVAGPKQKGGRYVAGRRKEKGRAATDLLGQALAEIAAKIPFRKSMRWGSGATSFGRPVQWLVALFGDRPIDFTFAELKSGTTTRGHRFLAPAPITVANADAYVDLLRQAHVLVDRRERAETMMRLVQACAKEVGGVHDPAPMLVDENTSLVEEPHVIRGNFERVFLELPAAVIRAVARGHQRYFCVQKSEDELLPHYLAVVNTANVPENVRKGNDRVMRARLADARFFFEEDKKAKLEERVKKLEGIVFHARLGTVREKVERIEKLVRLLGDHTGADEALTARAAHLCKFDLVSLMVGEFPELQGHMGRAYARHAGEDPIVADAVRDHYRPVGASDDLPPSNVAMCVALADRLDTLVGCFAVGLQPTGAADPFALRRNSIAALRMLAEVDSGLTKVKLSHLFEYAYDGYAAKKLDVSREETTKKILEFSKERLRGILSTHTSSEIADAVLGAATSDNEEFPRQAMVRALALRGVVDARASWLEKAKTVAKRLNGIRGDARPVRHGAEAFAKSGKASEKDCVIVEVVDAVAKVTESLRTVDEVRSALQSAEELARRVDEIFVTTLVNDPNDENTAKRLEMLSYGADCMLRIADFSRLSGGSHP